MTSLYHTVFKKTSQIKYLLLTFTIAVISLSLVTTVYSQTPDSGNYALQFDGINDYISSYKSVGITGNQPRTISAWIFVNDFYENMPVIDWGETGEYGGLCQISINNLPAAVMINIDYGGFSTYPGFIKLNTWYHVAFVYDGSIGKIYLNGVLNAQTTLELNTINSILRIAIHDPSDPDDWNRYFNGTIDEVRIWNVARTQPQIQADMLRELSGSEAGLVTYWQFNEGEENDVYDLSSSGNNGVKREAAWINSTAPLNGYYLQITPDYGYTNDLLNVSITGINTHFTDSSGTEGVWLSKNDMQLEAATFRANSNISLNAEFTIPADAPVGFWDLNVATAVDSLMTMHNAIKIIEKANYALKFDGRDDFIDIGVVAGYSDKITVEAWIKTGQLPDWHNIINGECSDIKFVVSENKLNFKGQCDSPIGDDTWSKTLLNDNIWHHVAGTYDGTEVCVYVDGIKESCNPANGSFEPSVKNIGADRNGNENFAGLIDEVRIWNYVLSNKQISTNSNNSLLKETRGLIAYWSFDEGAGNIAYDYSGNDFHGTVSGAKWVTSESPGGKPFFFSSELYAYQKHNFYTHLRGLYTHFLDNFGTKNIVLSRNDTTLNAANFTVHSNTSIDAQFYIPAYASSDYWDLYIETDIDSVLTMVNKIEILPPPKIISQSSNTSSWLRSLYAIDDKVCWAVGNDGRIQKTSDGITWQAQNSSITDVLNSVYFTDKMAGWTAGQYGTILHTTNGGENWQPQNSGSSNNLQSVYFINNNTGWIVGRNGTILKTSDAGTNWLPQNNGISSWLYAVCFTDINSGWAVGSNGTILHTTNSGETWDPQTSHVTDYLTSVHFYDSQTGWVVGSNGIILKTVDGGANWQLKDSVASDWLSSVDFYDDQLGWAVGANGLFIITLDGGESWSTRKTFTTKELNAVCFADANNGWTAGANGTTLKMTMSDGPTAIDEPIFDSPIPKQFRLYQNYPNPFNPITTIKYDLAKTADVSLKVYSFLGREIITLVNGRQSFGTHQVIWDGKDKKGQAVSSGIYLCILRTAHFSECRKMVFIK